jgi:hypothetical protein
LQIRARKVSRLVNRMRELLPYLTEQDVPCCRGWAEVELIGAALFAAIMKDGAIHTTDGDIAARRVVNDWRQIKMLQLAYERELGLTPAARATLRAATKGESDFDLVAAMAGAVEPVEPEPPAGDPPEGEGKPE